MVDLKKEINHDMNSPGISPNKESEVAYEVPAPFLSGFNFNRTLMSFCM
jgi:hypothetical protein